MISSSRGAIYLKFTCLYFNICFIYFLKKKKKKIMD